MSTSRPERPGGNRGPGTPVLRPMPVWAGITVGTLLGLGAMLARSHIVLSEDPDRSHASNVVGGEFFASDQPATTLLWAVLAIAVLALAVVPLAVRSLGPVTPGADGTASVPVRERSLAVHVLGVARIILVLLTVIGFGQLPVRVFLVVSVPQGWRPDDIVGLVLLAALVVVLHGFEQATAPWTIGAAERARLAEVAASRGASRDEHDPAERAARRRSRGIRSYVIPATIVFVVRLVALVPILLVGAFFVLVEPTFRSQSASMLVDISNPVIFAIALTLASTAMLKRALRSVAERRLRRRGGWDGWFAALLFVALLSLAVCSLPTTLEHGIQNQPLRIVQDPSPFLAAIIGALAFREWRVQEDAYLDRFRGDDPTSPQEPIERHVTHAATPEPTLPDTGPMIERDPTGRGTDAASDGSPRILARGPASGSAAASARAPAATPVPALAQEPRTARSGRRTAVLRAIGVVGGLVWLVLGGVGLTRSLRRRRRP